MKKEHEVLFTPMQVGSVTVKNRFVHAPMEGTTPIDWSMGFKFNQKSRQYLLEKAQNDVGLIIPGITCVRSFIGKKWLYQNEKLFMGPVKELMDEIHANGAKLFLQLGAGFGRVLVLPAELKKVLQKKWLAKLLGMDKFYAAASEGMPNVWAPSFKHSEMTEKEIQDMIDGFVKSAVLCKKAGIDGVEIHAIHEGYLLDQFTVANTNGRKDQYGGSLENRARFVTEIIRGIKKACGEDYPVIIRYSVTSKMRGFNQGAVPGEEYKEFGRDREESVALAKLLEQAGADALDADNGSYDAWFWAHPPLYMPMACNLEDAKFIKQHVNIPVFCAGRMEDPDRSAKAVAAGEIDGVTIGRQFLADGEYCKKLAAGDIEDIRPCIACHNGCFPISKEKGEAAAMGPNGNAHCAINPRTLEETKKALKPIAAKKKIAVIGGGIGGMEAARVARLRGHEVALYEKTGELGGVFIAAAAPEFKEKDKMLIQWYIRQMNKLGVKLHMNAEMTQEALKNLDADEIILATGAKERVLSVPGMDPENMMTAIDYLRGRKQAGQNVLVVGGGLTGCEIAYDLALHGKKPVIVEMLDDILNVPHLCAANSNMLRELIRYYQIPVHTGTKVQEVRDGKAVLEGAGEIPCDSIISSIGYIAGAPLADKDNKHIHVIGDADKVGNLMSVIWQAYDLANEL